MTNQDSQTETAADRYAHHAKVAKNLLLAIENAIDVDANRVAARERATGRKIDWADVGTIEEVARKLAEIAQFLGSK